MANLDSEGQHSRAQPSPAAERWRQVRSILEGVLARTGSERQAALERGCGDDAELRQEVESLVAAHDTAGTFIDRPIATLSDPEEEVGESVGEVVGAYRLDRLLARGGMGTVYLANRADGDFCQRVALKILKRGMDTDEIVRRFAAERQILADLEHPYIARLIDGGSTPGGRPFLVMEYVDGEPIDHYCDTRKLSIRARIRLFLAVCRAVHYAHQHLIVHRDLKPSNILVQANGEPKLLDFGIAKILAPQPFPCTVPVTAPGFAPLTPEYASPEQVLGERITTASDVYSLGVLLYRLLTGQGPYGRTGRGPGQIIKAVCEAPAEKPSHVAVGRLIDTTDHGRAAALEAASAARGCDPRKLGRQLAGDLDTILLGALRKEPERRYATVISLSQDLEQYLAGRPISARRESLGYQLGKLIGRHKVAACGVTIAAVALLTLVSALWHQRSQLLHEQHVSTQVTEFLVELFRAPDPFEGSGEQTTVRSVLQGGVERLEHDLANAPEVRSELLEALGRSYLNLALYDESRTLLQDAYELRRELYGENRLEVAASLHLLGDLEVQTGRFAAAEERYRQALELRRATLDKTDPAILESLHGLAVALDELDQRKPAEDAYREALVLARQAGRPLDLARLLDHFSDFLREADDYDGARKIAQEALEIHRQHWGPEHPAVADGLNHLALIEKHSDPQRAESYLLQAESIQRRAFTRPHAHLALTLTNLGNLMSEAGRLEDAEKRFREAASIQAEVYGGPHPRWATTLDLLAGVQANRSDLEGAITRRREVLAMRQGLFGPDHIATARSCNNLAKLLAARGDFEEALNLYRRSLQIVNQLFGAKHRHVAVLVNNLGEIYAARGETEQAEHLFEQALATLRETVAEDSHLLVAVQSNLGNLQRRQGNLVAAGDTLEQALRIAETRWSADSARASEVEIVYAALLNDRGEHSVAERRARHALKVLREFRPDTDAWIAVARLQVGRSLIGQGQELPQELSMSDTQRVLSAQQGLMKIWTAEQLLPTDRVEATEPGGRIG